MCSRWCIVGHREGNELSWAGEDDGQQGAERYRRLRLRKRVQGRCSREYGVEIGSVSSRRGARSADYFNHGKRGELSHM